MEKHKICGEDGLEVSIVGLGCNAFGNRIDESSTHNVINAAIESGIKKEYFSCHKIWIYLI